MKIITLNINPYDVQEMRRTKTNKQIAAYYGVNLNTFYYWCYRNHVPTARVTEWEVTEAIQNMTVKEIAYEYNVGIGVVYRALKKNGISAKQYR